ncbi:hypothetical protein [Mycobacterium sp.]|uniref:hypothetical protein n=1 Tax=Mycobacterium sp. TaxID=1785 RepID=UPI0025FE8E96|nr:hypothetical protein [Mycobacterium sp.]
MPTTNAAYPTRAVSIPRRDAHDGIHIMSVTLPWRCPHCGGPRGQVFRTISYDGSRRLACDGWKNPCGHIDFYAAVRHEANILATPPHTEPTSGTEE